MGIAGEVKEEMGAALSNAKGGIADQKAKAKAGIDAADAKSVAGFEAAQQAVSASLTDFTAKANAKFGDLTEKMADQRTELDNALAGSIDNINDAIAKQAAIQDSRFSKTVKDVKAAREAAAEEVKQARKDFATDLAAVTASIKGMETKLIGDIQVVSGAVISHKAAQATVNRKVKGELKRIQKLMNHRKSESDRARGKLRTILDENKRAAAEEVKALDGLFKGKLASIRKQAADDTIEARQDLTEKAAEMAEALEAAQREQLYETQERNVRINAYSQEALGKIAAAKKAYTESITTLANTEAANRKKTEAGFEVLTGVIRDYKAAGKADRALLRKQNAALDSDMNKAIDRAVQEGEARANAIGQRARQNLAAAKQSMLIEITEKVEDGADQAFKTIQEGRGKIADNYLSLKAYAVTAKEKITEYVAQGKGKNLSSLGNLLTSIGQLSNIKVEKREGFSASKVLAAPFSGAEVKVDNSVSKINGLVDEFMEEYTATRKQWTVGLGKYLLEKLNAAMGEKGVLQVDKVSDKSGNFVFINGHAVGLSNKLSDFESLAVRMGHYEATLAKLTAGLSGKGKKPKPLTYAKPPEWDGN